jgi:hypothetical protein
VLASGLTELGFEVEVGSEKEAFNNDVDWHVVIAPHEFFYLAEQERLSREALPRNIILLNTEQPSTQWFARAREFFPKAHAIWDINYSSAESIRSMGFSCAYLPLGYVPDFELFGPVPRLPFHYGTCFLEPEIVQGSFLMKPIMDRPIDVLFVGYLSPRRDKFFTAAAPLLSRYRCYFYFWDAQVPIVPGKNTYMNTTTAIGLAQRAKIMLNLHHGDDQYFEWHRVVMHGIWQRALVISELCDPAPPFKAGRDFVAVPLEEMPDKIAYHLSSADGQARGQIIADRGFDTLTEGCRLADALRLLIGQLHEEKKGRISDPWYNP